MHPLPRPDLAWQAPPPLLHLWRHARPEGAAGRCIGHTNLPVHWRRSKRLARRIQAEARRARRPHTIVTSPLQRCADVGRWLARWGWRHRLDAQLLEMDFGTWDGRAWADIDPAEVATWADDLLHTAVPGGESLAQLAGRVAPWQPGADEWAVVGHAGWLSVRARMHAGTWPIASARDWPSPPAHGACVTSARTLAAAGPA